MNLPINYRDSSYIERRNARDTYIKVQNGRCCYCGESLDKDPSEKIMKMSIDKDIFPPDFFKWPVHLHHDHGTKMTVGAVHSRCNAVLWQYYDE